ncbi:MAG: rod shape-determining protein MreC [Lachnospiraceae bacterium]|nr:rod shape-determining protein MreC [Lachnospiraceae bacterium]
MARVKVKRRGVKIPPGYLLLILTVVSVLLMIMTFTTDIVPTIFNGIAGYTFMPFKKGLSGISVYANQRADDFKQIRDVISENKALKEQIDELTEQNDMLVENRFELIELRGLLDLDSEYEEYEKIGARVTGKDPGNWYSVFIIDKGEEDGIKEGMNVLAGSGLVGLVTKTGPNWAQVRSIIDDQSNVSARMLNTSDNLIVYGNLEAMKEGTIEFGQLSDSDDEVAVGDKIVTSNISDRYLPGIAIGYINTIEKDPNNLTKSGTLTPVVDFEHIDVVLVITQMKEENSLE